MDNAIYRPKTKTSVHAARAKQLFVAVAISTLLRHVFETVDEAFEFFDVHKAGKISSTALFRGLASLGVEMSHPLRTDLIRIIDTDANGQIDPKEFSHLYNDTFPKPRQRWEEIRRVAEALTKQHGSLEAAYRSMDISLPSGRLTCQEFLCGVLSLKQKELGTRKVLEQVFRVIDTDRDGMLCLEEFLQVLEQAKASEKSSNLDDRPLVSSLPGVKKAAAPSPDKKPNGLLSGQSGRVATELQDDVDSYRRRRVAFGRRIGDAVKAKHGSLFQAFKVMEERGDGFVSERALRDTLAEIVSITPGQLRVMMDESADAQGFVSYTRFLQFLAPAEDW
mmetsp:Transcript_39340/g.85195  ORF Transcript_39340/g.85195 Transcript_39340/m.85195 type:complete len:335 (-) Transcript_39340:103-1107(-)